MKFVCFSLGVDLASVPVEPSSHISVRRHLEDGRREGEVGTQQRRRRIGNCLLILMTHCSTVKPKLKIIASLQLHTKNFEKNHQVSVLLIFCFFGGSIFFCSSYSAGKYLKIQLKKKKLFKVDDKLQTTFKKLSKNS
jgi:hypothetical protein